MGRNKKPVKKRKNGADERLLEVVLALISAFEFREPMAVGHSERVTKYALLIAAKLNFTGAQLLTLKYAGLLHDIGKIGVDAHLLNKNSTLTPEEYEEVKKHPVIAKSILNPIKGLREVIPIIYSHHERYDGKGYPDGLAGEKIPLESRIINIADAYDAITSNRPYRQKKSSEEACKILEDERNKQMDGKIVDIFIPILHDLHRMDH
jgi:putative nucleotidyltransferase with HDIG domain